MPVPVPVIVQWAPASVDFQTLAAWCSPFALS